MHHAGFGLGALLVSVLLAAGTFRFVETPIRRHGSDTTAKLLVVASAAVAIVGSLISQGLISPSADSLAVAKIDDAVGDWAFPNGLTSFAFGEQKFFRRGMAPPTVLFAGDSLMQQYWPRVEVLTRGPALTKAVIFATRGGCPPSVNLVLSADRACVQYIADLRVLADDPTIDTVVVTASWETYLRAADVGKHPIEPASELEEWLRKLAKSKRVIVILMNPYGARFDPRRMVKRNFVGFDVDVSPEPREEATRLLARSGEQLRRIAARVRAEVIDPVDYLCDVRECPVVTAGGDPLYMDHQHLRPFAVRERMTFLDSIVAR
jgi:hypothetical protein